MSDVATQRDEGDARPTTARVEQRDDWRYPLAPSTAGLDLRARAALAVVWRARGQAEHASIAAFGRLALELLSVGAPADLVASAQAAALDQVTHASICFEFASDYCGIDQGPAALPVERTLERCGDLEAIVRGAVEQACVGRTIAAALAEVSAGEVIDPVVGLALERIAEDAARHAALGWRVVQWAIRVGPESIETAVRGALADALADALACVPAITCAVGLGPVQGSRAQAIAVRVGEAFVGPLAAALLGSDGADGHRAVA